MDFKFTNNPPRGRFDEMVEYLLGPRLWIANIDYPDYEKWAQKVYWELISEKKRALVAFSRERVVGMVLYQKHKKEKDALEIKNLTVRPDHQGRYIASFLLRNTEIEGKREFNAYHALVDAKVKNFAIKNFFLSHKYRIIGQKDLYGLGAGEDYIYRKDFAA